MKLKIRDETYLKVFDDIEGMLAAIVRFPDAWGGQESRETVAATLLDLRATCLELEPGTFDFSWGLRQSPERGDSCLSLSSRGLGDLDFNRALERVIGKVRRRQWHEMLQQELVRPCATLAVFHRGPRDLGG